MTPALRNMETGGRKRRKPDCNLKKPQLLVGTKPNGVGSPVMWRLANRTGPLTVGNKVVGSKFMFEAHVDWSIRIPVVSVVYSRRWLIVSAGLKALFWELRPLCCCYSSLSGFYALCICAQLDVSRESFIIPNLLTYEKKDYMLRSNQTFVYFKCLVNCICVCFMFFFITFIVLL